MIRDLPHVFARIFGVPLLIQSTRLDALLAGLNAARLHRGSLLGPPEIELPAETSERPRGYSVRQSVATVPVRGVLVRRAGQMTPDSTPLQSYQNLTQVLRHARANRGVRGILLDVDSPGGEAGGIFDFAEEIRAGAGDKPTWAIANDDAMSAAYAIAAAAQKVWITDTGAAGSIGVVALHLDQSHHDAEAGLAYSYIFKGAHKIDANPHAPLTIEARGAIQGEIDRIYDKFTSSVAGHRKLEASKVRATEAQVYFADNAKREGLVDDVGNFDQAHQALAEFVNGQSGPRGGSRMDNEDTTIETNVVSLDTVRSEATAQAIAYAQEVSELCKLAKHPEMTADFLKRGAPALVVARELMELNARQDQARPIETIDTSSTVRTSLLGNQAADVIKANSDRMRAYQTPVRNTGI